MSADATRDVPPADKQGRVGTTVSSNATKSVKKPLSYNGAQQADGDMLYFFLTLARTSRNRKPTNTECSKITEITACGLEIAEFI